MVTARHTAHKIVHTYRVAGFPLASEFPVLALAPFATDRTGPLAGSGRTASAGTEAALVIERLRPQDWPRFEHKPAIGDDSQRSEGSRGDGQTRYCQNAALGPSRYDLHAAWPEPDTCWLFTRQCLNPEEASATEPSTKRPPESLVESLVSSQARAHRFLISPRGIAVGAVEAGASVDELLLTGPALAVALALRSVFLLHASAVVFDGVLCVFLAESGSGKSTLAGYLADHGAQAVADDILSMSAQPGIGPVRALGEFPQWKWPPQQQPFTGNLPERMRWFFVQPAAGKKITDVAIEPLGQGETLLKLARHGVATRLFNAHSLRQHQTFCQQAASLPGAVLHYPHRWQSLNQVAACLRAYLKGAD